jgi:type 1 fimbria pilin
MKLMRRAGLLTLAISLASSAAHAGLGTLAFVGARIIDGTNSPAIENGVLISVDGKIVAVGSTPMATSDRFWVLRPDITTAAMYCAS